MKKFKIVYLVLLVIITSCDSKKEESTSDCRSKVLDFLFLTDDAFGQIEKNDSIKNLIKEVDELTLSIIERSGGIALDGKSLFSGCESAYKHYNYFKNFVDKKIKPYYLSMNHSANERLISTLEKNFLSTENYFDENYFKSHTIEQLSYDLLIVELQLIQL